MKLMVALLLSFFVVFALWYSSQERKSRRQNWFLVSSLVLFAIYLLISGNTRDPLAQANEYGLFLSNLCVLMFMPGAWLYTRSMLTGRNITRRDWVHVLPAGVYLINALYLFGEGVMRASIPLEQLVRLSDGFLNFGHCVVLGYLFLQLQILLPQIREICEPVTRSFYPLLRWALILAMAQTYFLWYRFAGSESQRAAEVLWLQIPVIFECIVIVGIYVLHLVGKYLSSTAEVVDERQLEHIDIIEQIDSSTEAQSGFLAGLEVVAPRIEFQDFQLQHFEEKVRTTIAEKKQFLTPGYTIRMLSEETGISSHLLSAFINRRYQMNFNDFINEYRIHFCIEKIKNEEWKYKTLEALSRESGFNNRNSFTLSFKKVVGETPSDFLKKLKV